MTGYSTFFVGDREKNRLSDDGGDNSELRKIKNSLRQPVSDYLIF